VVKTRLRHWFAQWVWIRHSARILRSFPGMGVFFRMNSNGRLLRRLKRTFGLPSASSRDGGCAALAAGVAHAESAYCGSGMEIYWRCSC
jgi:hypothetical protein